VRLDERKLKIARYLFDTHSGTVVFAGRFVSVLRTYAAFLAGVSKMRWRKFLPANAAGGLIWAGLYALASYLAGTALQRASGTIDWVLAGAAAVAVVPVLVLLRRHAGRLAVRAEAAYPGPLEGGQHNGKPVYSPARPGRCNAFPGPPEPAETG
jgi:membrane protein DedA with SNARE-associated domain